MVAIFEMKGKGLPVDKSLFVKFDFNQTIVNILKSLPSKVYHKETKLWEIPISSLAQLVDTLSQFEDIDLIVEDDNKEISTKEYKSKIEHKIKPFDYQLDGINYGLNHNAWMLLDAPGLGKTLQMIYLAEELKLQKKVKHCLIICGINNLKTNWENEIKKFSNEQVKILGKRVNKKGVTVFDGVEERLAELKKPIDEFFVITNVETLRDDRVIKELTKKTTKNKFDLIVVDEVHKCKSPTSEQGKHLLKLNATYKIALTGTLIMNNPLDAYVPLKFLGKIDSNFTNYKSYYCEFDNWHRISGFRHLNELKEQIATYSLRRTKDLLNLPPKMIINEVVDMKPDQMNFYQDVVKGIAETDRVDLSTTNLLGMCTRLRQASSCPSILTSEDISAAKLDRAEDLVEEIIEQGESVVIFSGFKESCYNLGKRLEKYKPYVLTGDTKQDIIDKAINDFQKSKEPQIIIGTWQKLGTGITLTKASYMLFIDTPWTSAEFEQSCDRIYRIGTSKSVTIYNLICKDTIDERVRDILDTKEALSDYLVDDAIKTQGAFDILSKYIMEL